MAVEVALVSRRIKDCLSDDLLHKSYPRNKGSYLAGHCYIASEAAYYLLGGRMYWTPYHVKHEGVSHWFLVHKDTKEILDITAKQFKTRPPYLEARGKGFLTKRPCKRTQKLLSRIKYLMREEHYARSIRKN